MANYDYISTDYQGTLYSSICPKTEDYFVSVETYQREARGDIRILHSVVASKGPTHV